MATVDTLAPAPAPPRPKRPGQGELCDVLAGLYRQQLALDPGNGYIRDHARPKTVWDQVQTFRWYAQQLPGAGVLLDWGCRHAPDSCLLRATFGHRYELHGCDFVDSAQFRPFHEYANIQYSRLAEPVALPYPSEHFDVVIASGVIEHVALEQESLRELYRVLRTDGHLVVTYLPNAWSVQEWRYRTFHRNFYHQRRYGMGEALRMLRRWGFCPLRWDYQTFRWERLLGTEHASALSRTMRAVAPWHWFCSTLCMVAVKVKWF